jgi:hypothetical protein
MKSVGSLVRAFMLSTYELPNSQVEVHDGERLYFEGIYMTASVSTCEIMLGMVEIFVMAANGVRKRSIAVYTDKYLNIKLDNIAWIEYVDSDPGFCKNIQRDGLARIPKVQIPDQVKDESGVTEEQAAENSESIWATIKLGNATPKKSKKEKPSKTQVAQVFLTSDSGKQRDLVRYKVEDQTDLPELADNSTTPFDQFKGRKTNFEFSDYSTKIDTSKIT